VLEQKITSGNTKTSTSISNNFSKGQQDLLFFILEKSPIQLEQEEVNEQFDAILAELVQADDERCFLIDARRGAQVLSDSFNTVDQLLSSSISSNGEIPRDSSASTFVEVGDLGAG